MRSNRIGLQGRQIRMLFITGFLTLATCWLLPVLGLAAAVVFVVLVAPIGSRLKERAAASVVLALSILAVLALLPGLLDLNWWTSRALVCGVVFAVIVARLLRKTTDAPFLPRCYWSDAIGVVAGGVVGLMIVLPFVGASPGGIISGLLTSWDLWAHFAFFANTYEAGTSAWQTADPSGAYGVGYPQLPFVVWTVLQWLVQGSSDTLDREQLLLPYVTWIATTVAACATLLTWFAGDVAERLGLARSRGMARLLASVAMGVLVIFGSLGTYASAGHANFLLGVCLVAIASYWALVPECAPREVGWLMVPGAALCAIALWPPLVLGVAPAGVGVIVSLWSWRRPVAITYAAVTSCAIAIAGWKYLSILVSSASVESLSMGGASGGLASYSIPLAIMAPLIVLAGSAVAWTKRGWRMAIALASATVGLVPFTLYLMASVDAAATPRLDSYFLLKVAGGLVVMATPIIVAFSATVVAAGTEDLVQRLGGNQRAWRSVLVACGAGGLAAGFGLMASPNVPNGFPQAPGFAAYQQRIDLVRANQAGEAVVAAADWARAEPMRAPLFWDNNGVLLTSWCQALLGVRSNDDVRIAETVGIPATGNPPVAEFIRLIRERPRLRLTLFWLDKGIFEPLRPVLQQFGTSRVDARNLGDS